MIRDRTSQGKISIHYSVVGFGGRLAFTYGPRVLRSYVLVALLGWFMVDLEGHTIAQLEAAIVLCRLGPVNQDVGWRGFLRGDDDLPGRRSARPAGAA